VGASVTSTDLTTKRCFWPEAAVCGIQSSLHFTDCRKEWECKRRTAAAMIGGDELHFEARRDLHPPHGLIG